VLAKNALLFVALKETSNGEPKDGEVTAKIGSVGQGGEDVTPK
jgi:hypothetical protein